MLTVASIPRLAVARIDSFKGLLKGKGAFEKSQYNRASIGKGSYGG
jgi:hypothetical protein